MSNLHETDDKFLLDVAAFLDQAKPITTLSDDNTSSSEELSSQTQELALLQEGVVIAAKRNIELGWETEGITIHTSWEAESELSIILDGEILHSIHPDLSDVNISHNDDPSDLEPARKARIYTGDIIYLGGIATEENMEEQFDQWEKILKEPNFITFSSSIPTSPPPKLTGYMFTKDGASRKLVIAPLYDPRQSVMTVQPIAKVVPSRLTRRDIHLVKTVLTITRDRLMAP